MLAAAGRFHQYSFGNVLLILAQNPEETRVAGYRTWQSIGRQVRKGERGIQILAPVTYRPREGSDRGFGGGAEPVFAALASYCVKIPTIRSTGQSVAGTTRRASRTVNGRCWPHPDLSPGPGVVRLLAVHAVLRQTDNRTSVSDVPVWWRGASSWTR
jgi:hypothetical protein